MKKIKEFIKVNRQSALNNFHACYTKNYTDAYKANYWDGVAEGYDKSLDFINQESQDYTFIRVPKKVKLSEIIEYLENKAKNDSLLQDDEGNLMWHLTYEVRKPTDGSYIQILEDCVEEPRNHIPSQLKVEIYNNKITSCKFILEDEYKELYNMWFYQTFIEVDV